MPKVFALFLLTCASWGQSLYYQTGPELISTKPSLTYWKTSVLALGAASTLDIASSWGQQERNPVLGRGTFGTRQLGVKVGLVGGTVLGEWLWLRKHPQHGRVLTYVNLGVTGVTVGVSIHNFKTPHK